MVKLPDEVLVNRKQLLGEVHDNNVYRELLSKCLDAFNEMPNNEIYWGTTYGLAKNIETVLRNDD